MTRPTTPTRAVHLPERYNAADIVARNLAERPDAVALVCGDRSLTFAEVAAEVGRFAAGLRARGLRAGDVVAILCADVPEHAIAYFGILAAGGIAADLNTRLTAHEHAFMLEDCRARAVVVDATLAGELASVRDGLPEIENVIVVGAGTAGGVGGGDETWEEVVRGRSAALELAPTHRDDFACLNYSSGTTGEPKGIVHAHKDLPLCAELVGRATWGLTERDRTFAVSKLFFTFGTGGNLVFPWHVGASIALFPGWPRDPTDVLDAVARHRPTVWLNAPTGYAALLAAEGFPERWDISSVRLCVSSGESLPAPLWHAWRDATGLELLDGIGSTENYHMFICNRPGEVRPGSSGVPVPGYEARIVDDDGTPTGIGGVGRLHVRGETAALFYLHQYARSRATFLGEWLDTGDKYRVDEDGYYWHAGRADDMLKVGGIWVSPVEVEATVTAHPAVRECAVVGAEDDAGLVKPKAYVVLAPGFEASAGLASEIIDYCRTAMADYKRPRRVVFVDALPRTTTGKVRRFALRDE